MGVACRRGAEQVSSFAYLLTVDELHEGGSWVEKAEQLAEAPHRVPLLWIALLGPTEPRMVGADCVVMACPTADAVGRLAARKARLVSWLASPHAAGYVTRFAERIAEEAQRWLLVDVSEVAAMDEPGALFARVDVALRWLDGDDQASDGPTALTNLSGITPNTKLPRPDDGLEDGCSPREWDRVLSMLGAGQEWWD